MMSCLPPIPQRIPNNILVTLDHDYANHCWNGSAKCDRGKILFSAAIIAELSTLSCDQPVDHEAKVFLPEITEVAKRKLFDQLLSVAALVGPTHRHESLP